MVRHANQSHVISTNSREQVFLVITRSQAQGGLDPSERGSPMESGADGNPLVLTDTDTEEEVELVKEIGLVSNNPHPLQHPPADAHQVENAPVHVAVACEDMLFLKYGCARGCCGCDFRTRVWTFLTRDLFAGCFLSVSW